MTHFFEVIDNATPFIVIVWIGSSVFLGGLISLLVMHRYKANMECEWDTTRVELVTARKVLLIIAGARHDPVPEDHTALDVINDVNALVTQANEAYRLREEQKEINQLCQVYFEIAADATSEEHVREERDTRLYILAHPQ